MSLRKLLVVLVLGGGLAAGLTYRFVIARPGDDPDRIKVSGNIEVIQTAVSFKIPGLVKDRPVDEGMPVKRDETLVAVLDTSDLECDVALRAAELAAAEAALAELEAGSRPEEIAAAEATKQKAEAALKELKSRSPLDVAVAEATLARVSAEKTRLDTELGRAAKLRDRNMISAEEYDRAKTAFEVAVAQLREAAQQLELVKEQPRAEQIKQVAAALAQAAAQYDLVKKGPRDEDIAQARARKEQAKAVLHLAETRLGYATLKAPTSGLVLSKNVEPGEYVAPGTPVVTIGDFERTWLRAYINETDLGRVKEGQTARVTTDTYLGKAYQGKVTFISSEAEFTPKNVQTQQERVKLVYRIKIDIPNPNRELKPGMPADAEIDVTAP